MLHVFQAKLLCCMEESGPAHAAFKELRSATNLALRATKMMAQAIGRSMTSLMEFEDHLWLTLTEIKVPLLHSTISPTGLFGRLKLRGDCAFSIAGPNLWNSLPFSLRLVSSESEFKSKLKTYLSNYQTCSYLFVFLYLCLFSKVCTVQWSTTVVFIVLYKYILID